MEKQFIASPDLSKRTNVCCEQEQYSHYLNSRNEYERPNAFYSLLCKNGCWKYDKL